MEVTKMIALHPEYVIDNKKEKKAVIIKFNEWNKILDEIEELDEIRAYDKAKSDLTDEVIPLEQALNEIKV
jgi:alpha-L-arabinofuranosidase